MQRLGNALHCRILAGNSSTVRVLGKQKGIHAFRSGPPVQRDLLAAQQRLPEATQLPEIELLLSSFALQRPGFVEHVVGIGLAEVAEAMHAGMRRELFEPYGMVDRRQDVVE